MPATSSSVSADKYFGFRAPLVDADASAGFLGEAEADILSCLDADGPPVAAAPVSSNPAEDSNAAGKASKGGGGGADKDGDARLAALAQGSFAGDVAGSSLRTIFY